MGLTNRFNLEIEFYCLDTEDFYTMKIYHTVEFKGINYEYVIYYNKLF